MPNRILRKTAFAFGEGESENVFLKHLRGLYADGKTQTKVDHAGGKDVNYILEKATRIRSTGHYDHSFILLDTVPEWPKSIILLARERDFELIGNHPCIEATFRSILVPGRNLNGDDTRAHKRLFSNDHIGGRNVISEVDCKRLFLKARIDSARKASTELNRLIEILEGHF